MLNPIECLYSIKLIVCVERSDVGEDVQDLALSTHHLRGHEVIYTCMKMFFHTQKSECFKGAWVMLGGVNALHCVHILVE